MIDNIYKDTVKRMTSYLFPDLTDSALDRALNWAIQEYYKPVDARIVNNYTKRDTEILLKDLTDYILEKEPIATVWGVLFKKHGTVPNPLSDMIKMFMDARGIHKDQMFQYPKGSEEFAKYFMLQILDKLDANATYGVLSNSSCLLYNLHVAASITSMGKELIAMATMFFESFLSNGVKFASLDEVLTFIDNVVCEKPERKYNDKDILDRDIDREECFAKLVYSIGDFRYGKVKWVPDMDDLDVIWTALANLSQEDINRLYYKNNLFAFMDNKSMKSAITYILIALDKPYLNPNEPPAEIKIELDAFQDILTEYVYYHHQIIDKVERCDNMIKNVCVVSDTDSAIVCLDGWYRYILDVVKDNKDKIKVANEYVNAFKYCNGDEDYVRFADYQDPVKDFDFANDEIIEIYRHVDVFEVIPQDNLRYSIINILSYVCGNLANDYLERFTKLAHSYSEEKSCLIYLKNEFLFKRLLLTMKKKNYASKQEVQEGNMIPESESLDVKGLPIKKSTLNKTTRERLQQILYDDILNISDIDQLKIIKDLAIFEKEIFQSLQSGDKEYYKPSIIKSLSTYDDPMRIQGIKGAVIWNAIKGDDLEAIDLSERNTVDIIKVDMNLDNIDKIKESYPDAYDRLKAVLNDKSIVPPKTNSSNVPGQISAISIPPDTKTPKWLLPFIDYTTIINDNLCNFPLESVGISKAGNSNINYTNILKI